MWPVNLIRNHAVLAVRKFVEKNYILYRYIIIFVFYWRPIKYIFALCVRLYENRRERSILCVRVNVILGGGDFERNIFGPPGDKKCV